MDSTSVRIGYQVCNNCRHSRVHTSHSKIITFLSFFLLLNHLSTATNSDGGGTRGQAPLPAPM